MFIFFLSIRDQPTFLMMYSCNKIYEVRWRRVYVSVYIYIQYTLYSNFDKSTRVYEIHLLFFALLVSRPSIFIIRGARCLSGKSRDTKHPIFNVHGRSYPRARHVPYLPTYLPTTYIVNNTLSTKNKKYNGFRTTIQTK